MSFLEIFFIVSGILLFFISLDIAKKRKFNALHFIVFLFVGIGLLVFTLFPETLNLVGKIFGLQRGADALVYGAIIFLLYFSILLLNKNEQNREDMTSLVREIALQNSKKQQLSGDIFFVIAAYNEGSVIRKTLQNLIDAKYKNIIVINDGSKDDTREILESFGGSIISLHHYKNRGQGAALETGFEFIRRYVDCEYVCTFDADGQHQIKDLEKFLQALKEDTTKEIALGSRFITKTNTNISFGRKIILKLGILFTFFVSNISLTDSHNGYRVMRKSALEKIKITLDGMGHASEIVDIIAIKKIPFIEVPVDILYTDYSKAKGQKSSNAINIAIKTLWMKFFR